MKKLKHWVFIGFAALNCLNAADIHQQEADTACSKNEVVEVEALVETLKSLAFDTHSEDVGGAYRFFAGQNILNAKDLDYRQWYRDGHICIDGLYGLYLALKEFLSEDGAKFVPDELNGGFTHMNYEFLKKIFD
jgi:hypothetical protein